MSFRTVNEKEHRNVIMRASLQPYWCNIDDMQFPYRTQTGYPNRIISSHNRAAFTKTALDARVMPPLRLCRASFDRVVISDGRSLASFAGICQTCPRFLCAPYIHVHQQDSILCSKSQTHRQPLPSRLLAIRTVALRHEALWHATATTAAITTYVSHL